MLSAIKINGNQLYQGYFVLIVIMAWSIASYWSCAIVSGLYPVALIQGLVALHMDSTRIIIIFLPTLVLSLLPMNIHVLIHPFLYQSLKGLGIKKKVVLPFQLEFFEGW